MHSAALSYRSKIPLDGKPLRRKQSSFVKRYKTGNYSGCRVQRALHHRVAAGSVGAGYSGCHR